MGIFGIHRHLKLKQLSEYLDGRLNASGEAKVAREVASCAVCQEELDSLQVTVSLLQRLPEMPPPRSFTLATAPTFDSPEQGIAPPSPMVFRIPNWAYAGAASLAGLALAVLVSADATGLLASRTLPDTGDAAASTSAAFESRATAPPATTPDAIAGPTAERPVAAVPQAEESRSRPADTEVAAESQGPALAEKGLAPPSLELDQAAESGPVESAADARAAEPLELQDAPTGGIAGTAGDGLVAPSVTSTPRPAAEAKVEPEAPVAQPAPVPQIPATQERKTALGWRISEGIAAGLGLLFLIVLALKWRRPRQSA